MFNMFNRIAVNNTLLRNGLCHRTSDTATVAVWYHYPDRPIDETNCFCVDYSCDAYVVSCLYDPSLDEVASVPSAESALLDFVSRPTKSALFALCSYFVIDKVILYDACADVQYTFRRDELACC